jgi:alanyl-tRNA synthetase
MRRHAGDAALISSVAGKVNTPAGELEKKVDALLAQQKDLEKQLQAARQKQAAESARGLLARANTSGPVPSIVENLGPADGDFLQTAADALKSQFKGVVVLGGTTNNAVALVASVSSDFTKKLQAGKILQAIAPLVGGRGGGKPDNARGGGKDVSKGGIRPFLTVGQHRRAMTFFHEIELRLDEVALPSQDSQFPQIESLFTGRG